MPSALRILSDVKAAGGMLEVVEPDGLRVAAPRPLPAPLLAQVRMHKPDIIRTLLDNCSPVSGLFDRKAYEERAAIIEANGVPREWAEGFATLCTMPRPAAYTPQRWQQLVDDAGRFLDSWGWQAAGLGWKALDAFGVNPDASECRYDCMGLVPLLQGRPVLAITASTARINCGNGVSQTYVRSKQAGAVALWRVA